MQRDGDSSPTGYFAVNNTIGYYYPKTDDLENETHLLVWISRADLGSRTIYQFVRATITNLRHRKQEV